MIDWKANIWDGCRFKEVLIKEKEIDFRRKKLNADCRFEDCPLNY